MTDPATASLSENVHDRYLSEREVRDALLHELRSKSSDSDIIEEFSAAGGRVDVLEVSLSSLSGFEIKSDFDSLDRVQGQITAFGRYVDTLTFVAGRRWALALLRDSPVWCGVKLAYRSGPIVRLIELRQSRQNPLIDLRSRLSLLWRAELLALSGTCAHSAARRVDLRERLLEWYSFEELRTGVSALLKQRSRPTSAELPTSRGGLSQLAATSLCNQFLLPESL